MSSVERSFQPTARARKTVPKIKILLHLVKATFWGKSVQKSEKNLQRREE
jgi:hypothetical protein